MTSEDSIIRDGDYSILQKVGGEQLRPCRLLSGQRVLIEKLSFDPTIAFGKPFGIFEVFCKRIFDFASFNIFLNFVRIFNVVKLKYNFSL